MTRLEAAIAIFDKKYNTSDELQSLMAVCLGNLDTVDKAVPLIHKLCFDRYIMSGGAATAPNHFIKSAEYSELFLIATISRYLISQNLMSGKNVLFADVANLVVPFILR